MKTDSQFAIGRLINMNERTIKSIPKIIIAFIACYIVAVGSAAILRHATFQSQAFDLAVFEHSMWNTLHGKFLFAPILSVENNSLNTIDL